MKLELHIKNTRGVKYNDIDELAEALKREGYEARVDAPGDSWNRYIVVSKEVK
ncbi:hypothetical protein LCGC14_0350080 [marine sediment metagenome]|uniref:Uncharacterized protein n=1 Tax=marine sediment metagenome TaxID=412755 RepID=A0A0F9VYH2_9ZZZZ